MKSHLPTRPENHEQPAEKQANEYWAVEDLNL